MGFLELKITTGSIAYDNGLKLTLNDPDNTDGLDRITLSELTAANPVTGGLLTIDEDADPSTQPIDDQTLNVTTTVSVPTGVEIGDIDLDSADVKFTLDLSESSVFGTSTGRASPTVSLTAMVDGEPVDLLSFSNISPGEVMGMLGQIKDMLLAMAHSELLKAELPFSGKTVGDALDFAEAFKEEVLDPLFTSGDILRPDDDGDGAVDLEFSSIQGLVTASALNIPGRKASYDPNSKELKFTIRFDHSLGEAIVQTQREGDANTNEIQRIAINATGGTFKLAFTDDDGLLEFTDDITFAAAAKIADDATNSVEKRLEDIEGIIDVNVESTDNGYEIEFVNPGMRDVPSLISDAADLIGFPIDFGASLGGMTDIQTSGAFGIAAGLNAELTFGIDLSPSQTLELTPQVYAPAEGVTVTRPLGATDNHVQIITVRNATEGTYTLTFGAETTKAIDFDAADNIATDSIESVEKHLQDLTGIDDVGVKLTTVGNHRFYVVTFNTPSNPASLLTADSTSLLGPGDNGNLSGTADFDVKLIYDPTTQAITRGRGAGSRCHGADAYRGRRWGRRDPVGTGFTGHWRHLYPLIQRVANRCNRL